MISFDQYSNKYPVYPGEFIPMLEAEDIDEEHRKRKNTKIKELSVNIIELKDIFRIEVIVPAVKREDFFIEIDNNVLSIIVFHKNSKINKNGVTKLHEFNSDLLERHILLPANVDAQLGQAEYKEGILYFYLPKTDHPLKFAPARIVVY